MPEFKVTTAAEPERRIVAFAKVDAELLRDFPAIKAYCNQRLAEIVAETEGE